MKKFSQNLTMLLDFLYIIIIVSFGIFSIFACTPEPRQVRAVSSPDFRSTQIDKIAVLVQGGQKVPVRLIEDEFITVLLSKGYVIPSRSDIEQIMKEMRFQQSGFTDKNAAEIGKILNVPAVMIVNVTDLKSERRGKYIRLDASIGARLISVEKSVVLWIGTDSGYEFSNDINKLLAKIANHIANSFPSR
jgi:hypothetical protein